MLQLVGPPSRGPDLRLLVVSTPRAGNTWTRSLLTRLYNFDRHRYGELAVHDPTEIPWKKLPRRCIIQLHWHKTDGLTSRLKEHGFRTLSLVRHPLDVLISFLQLAQHTKETARWLEAEDGDESALRGASPRSQEFLDYATGNRAAALLSVSGEWWTTPRTLRMRYEDLVADTAGGVRRLTSALGEVHPNRVRRAIAACAIERLVNKSNAPHFWQGKPELWRSLLTAQEVDQIAAANEDAFRRFEYKFDADPELTAEQADANWAFLRDNPRSSSKLKSA